jgi:streptogramin lyase
MQKTLITLFLFILPHFIEAQIPVGTWRDHLPYEESNDVTVGSTKVFAATPYSVFYYSLEDNSLMTFSKTNGLSESSISSIAYLDSEDILVIGYVSGNIDLILGENIVNIPDIKQSSFVGNKRINDILFLNGKAYLSCGFGIVELDLERREVADTWFINGQNDIVAVNTLVNSDTHWFAATESGIYEADLNNAFLANFQNWTKRTDLPLEDEPYTDLTIFNNHLIALYSNGNNSALWQTPLSTSDWSTVPNLSDGGYRSISSSEDQLVVTTFQRTERFDLDYNSLGLRNFIEGVLSNPFDAEITDNNTIWIATEFGGLMRWGGDDSELQVAPIGPPSNGAFRIDAFNDNIWVASGAVDIIWANNYLKDGTYGLVNDRWSVVPQVEGENSIGSINDMIAVSIDPTNNDRVMLGSWEEGLVEVVNGVVTNIYNEDNSTLQIRPDNNEGWIGVGGVDFDDQGNLWVTNTYSDTPLHLLTAGGSFASFEFGNDLNSGDLVGDVKVARNGYVWMVLPRGGGLMVLDPGESISSPNDDNYRLLSQEEGDGGLPSNEVLCVEEDLDGEVWIGTERGIGVFYAPQSIFESDNFDAQEILITQDGNVQILLETEVVTCIEIDGANRKWVGTRSSGAYLFSEDGLQQLAHFTEENSPLLSNNVQDIALNQRNGEVFFATQNGISSFLGTATNFDQEIEEVKVYPNPVEPGYEGLITIDGLAFETDVRITDAAGNAVYAGTSFGGRAVWDGTNFNGEKVVTGIYFVYCSTGDGSATNMGKVAIVR